ncbi:sigma-70 family RNA polymerase sigma factor [Methylobacterium gnaphalii]|uniref:RNA polymerase sigma factor n=1 Tax=Methylobacterium gnaphalii TaxID=1010610 RepID=A0A512JR99_9HYPH|nr:sigma-70 family RNA polymerase sigma factor [Methylobacterium gnaphalii]GEP12490.1 hypothetical protein MGN01_43350 [Methylobacterium gnaphalii]GJD71422.1 hypothetical protein MMMDOFMJ_4381 [Methylobacterium gnaphalii]GLS50610.1 hypothetical protein GCM10007885_34630 [Methylobacterium gnaphalii]
MTSVKDRVTDGTGELPAPTRRHLGDQLRALYGFVIAEPQPAQLLELIGRLEAALGAQRAEDVEAFRRQLVDALPGLRAFAMSLTINAAKADDLVQDTVLKAWANQHRYAPDTNLKAWLCTIMRNNFYSDIRRRKREVEDADGNAAAQLVTLPPQEHGMDLQKVWSLVARLPAVQREALMLVTAQGLTYEAAAALLACQVGTVKSRVSRARVALMEMINQVARVAA